MAEQFSNLAQTALSASAASGDATISVLTAAPFPSSAQYRIRVDSEIMIVTSGAGSLTWSVTRGAEGTPAAAHASGATVTHVLTAGALGGQSDPAAATPGLRTLGTGSQQAAAGNDARFTIDTSTYGAVADSNATGTTGTDNTTAFQNAINACSAAGGGTVHTGAGSYRVTGQILVPNRVVWRGEGRSVTNIIADNSVFPQNTPMITLGTTTGSSGSTTVFGTRVENMTIDCQHRPGSTAVYSNAAQERSGVRDFHTKNFTFAGVWFGQAGAFQAQNCEMIGVEVGLSDTSTVNYATTTLNGAQDLSLLQGSGTLTVTAVPVGAASAGAVIVEDTVQNKAFVVYYTGKTGTTLTGCKCPDSIATTTADQSTVTFGTNGIWWQNVPGNLMRVTTDVPNGVNTQAVGVRVDGCHGIAWSLNMESTMIGLLLGVGCSGFLGQRISGDTTLTDLVRVTVNTGTGFLLEELVKNGATNTINDLRASVNQAITNGPLVMYQGGAVGSIVAFSRNNLSDTALQTNKWADTAQRFFIWVDGTHKWGNGTATADTNLYRKSAGVLASDFKITAALGIGVGNSAAATTPGSVVKKMEVFDATGASLGFVPIYNSIT